MRIPLIASTRIKDQDESNAFSCLQPNLLQSYSAEVLRSMANLFLKQAKQYVATRPVYPPELFDFIASKTPRRNMAWDVGTGNGQAAASVSRSALLSPSPLPSPHARLLSAISCQ